MTTFKTSELYKTVEAIKLNMDAIDPELCRSELLCRETTDLGYLDERELRRLYSSFEGLSRRKVKSSFDLEDTTPFLPPKNQEAACIKNDEGSKNEWFEENVLDENCDIKEVYVNELKSGRFSWIKDFYIGSDKETKSWQMCITYARNTKPCMQDLKNVFGDNIASFVKFTPEGDAKKFQFLQASGAGEMSKLPTAKKYGLQFDETKGERFPITEDEEGDVFEEEDGSGAFTNLSFAVESDEEDEEISRTSSCFLDTFEAHNRQKEDYCTYDAAGFLGSRPWCMPWARTWCFEDRKCERNTLSGNLTKRKPYAKSMERLRRTVAQFSDPLDKIWCSLARKKIEARDKNDEGSEYEWFEENVLDENYDIKKVYVNELTNVRFPWIKDFYIGADKETKSWQMCITYARNTEPCMKDLKNVFGDNIASFVKFTPEGDAKKFQFLRAPGSGEMSKLPTAKKYGLQFDERKGERFLITEDEEGDVFEEEDGSGAFTNLSFAVESDEEDEEISRTSSCFLDTFEAHNRQKEDYCTYDAAGFLGSRLRSIPWARLTWCFEDRKCERNTLSGNLTQRTQYVKSIERLRRPVAQFSDPLDKICSLAKKNTEAGDKNDEGSEYEWFEENVLDENYDIKKVYVNELTNCHCKPALMYDCNKFGVTYTPIGSEYEWFEENVLDENYDIKKVYVNELTNVRFPWIKDFYIGSDKETKSWQMCITYARNTKPCMQDLKNVFGDNIASFVKFTPEGDAKKFQFLQASGSGEMSKLPTAKKYGLQFDETKGKRLLITEYEEDDFFEEEGSSGTFTNFPFAMESDEEDEEISRTSSCFLDTFEAHNRQKEDYCTYDAAGFLGSRPWCMPWARTWCFEDRKCERNTLSEI
ncbi:uncharacterized protein LOC114540233 [Dendronephthya gigantea]|uniref:uncharacterized protein LOC114540233 n=1 Tax=Dendronephthya gigantea TaxID=151771 RepID=UPI00106D9072|nr:uncharacterized protein LOC114540233 [Dendronephthya gigantea]